MTDIVSNIIQNSLSGFVSGAVTTIGGYAGDAVGGIGNIIERGGQSVGDGITKAFRGYGDSINSYGTAARNATAPNGVSSAPKTAAKRQDQKNKGENKKAAAPTAQKALPGSTVGSQKLLTYPGWGASPRPGVGARKSSSETVRSGKTETGGSKALTKYTPYTGYSGSKDSYAAGGANKSIEAANGRKSGPGLSSGQKGGQKGGQQANVSKKIVPEKRSKPGYKPPSTAGGSSYAPSDAASTVGSDFNPRGGFRPYGGYQPGGGYKGPGSSVGGYKKEPTQSATNADNLKAKTVAGGGARTPAPPKGPAAPGGARGSAQKNDGKVKISPESRPKRK